ncbi:MAG: chemotaxis protein CheB [Thermodesulfobacteriota bacterium]
MRKKTETGDGSPLYETIAIGVSAGGVEALNLILPSLPADLPLALLIVQHRPGESHNYLRGSLNKKNAITVKEADEKELIAPGTAYMAPANYHMLVESLRTISLSTSAPVNYSRPSIDVLFETAAEAYGPGLAGMVLTGANSDGSQGLKTNSARGGLAVMQEPECAAGSAMPFAALRAVEADHLLPLEQISSFISGLASIGRVSRKLHVRDIVKGRDYGKI